MGVVETIFASEGSSWRQRGPDGPLPRGLDPDGPLLRGCGPDLNQTEFNYNIALGYATMLSILFESLK